MAEITDSDATGIVSCVRVADAQIDPQVRRRIKEFNATTDACALCREPIYVAGRTRDLLALVPDKLRLVCAQCDKRVRAKIRREGRDIEVKPLEGAILLAELKQKGLL